MDPNNHQRCKKNSKINGTNCQPQLVSLPDFWLPSTLYSAPGLSWWCPAFRPKLTPHALSWQPFWKYGPFDACFVEGLEAKNLDHLQISDGKKRGLGRSLLVGGWTTHLKNTNVKMGSPSQSRDENKKYLQPPPSLLDLGVSMCVSFGSTPRAPGCNRGKWVVFSCDYRDSLTPSRWWREIAS